MESARVLVLIEEHYDETEYNVFNNFFPAHGVRLDYASYLWGNRSITFKGNDHTSEVEVTQCVSTTDPADYQGVILIGGYAMDRLRYATDVSSAVNNAPAVIFLREAAKQMDSGSLAIGTICHSLWLFCADPLLLKGRRVTCAHNILCDVINAGASVVYEGSETAPLHQDGLLISARHPGVVIEFVDSFLACIVELKQKGTETKPQL